MCTPIDPYNLAIIMLTVNRGRVCSYKEGSKDGRSCLEERYTLLLGVWPIMHRCKICNAVEADKSLQLVSNEQSTTV